ncbi:MAG: 1-deoxy-D-xylulose-5-phosphate reductoisomerase, partial [Clostridia bacterium]
SLAIKAAGEGGCACAILNGANEAVVSRFLNHEIGFLQIGDAVAEAISHVENTPCNSVSDVIAADHAAREFVLSH